MSEPRAAVAETEPREAHPWRLALLLVVLPYLLLSVAWAFSNPPSAAPDEQDHLVKALGSGRFQIGMAAEPLPADAKPSVGTRGQSITRIYSIPHKFASGYVHDCYAFHPEVSIACMPDTNPPDGPDVLVGTPMGAYPPFLYVPIGWAALQAPTFFSAFIVGRLVVALMSAALLFLGAGHLFRWLGRRALPGIVVAMTPMAVFTTGVLSISGIEITAGAAVACVVVVAAFRPESVLRSSTHWVLAVTGATLALSRQLGVIALAVMVLALLVFAGRSRARELLVSRRLSFWVAVAAMGASALLMVWWEHAFDHPAFATFSLDEGATRAFFDRANDTIEFGIGRFGYLDTNLPGAVIALWMAMWGLVFGLGVMLARRRDSLVLLGSFATMVALAYYVHVTVFYSIQASIQGRHFLSMAAFFTILAATVVVERLSPTAPWAVRRLAIAVGVFVPALQLFSVYWNARRYAVGSEGPVWFLPHAEWTPPLGFVPWLVMAAVGAALLCAGTVTSQRHLAVPLPVPAAEPAHQDDEEDLVQR
jgi:predicted membrane protein DUF2142